MSKLVKQMQMDALKKTFGDARDLVLVSISGVAATAENQKRLELRKKNIRLHTVKNSLAARVFKDMGINGLDDHLKGPITIAWGSSSIADLSKAVDDWAKKDKKVLPKIAVADGAVVPFEAAKKFPTRAQAIGEVIGLLLGPARQVVAQLMGPGGKVAGQIKTISERKEDAPPPAAAPAP
jgi:large subunit ribosomal protein L10